MFILEKNTKCSICGAQFSISGDVKTNVLIHRHVQEPYKCDICGAQFSHSGALKKVSVSVSILERNPIYVIPIAHICQQVGISCSYPHC